MKREYITFLKVFSALAVVLLHTNGVFWRFSYERYWITANCIESIFYFAVPVFFMISGATLIDYRKRYDTKTYFKKRFKSAVLPFITWSIISIVYAIKIGSISVSDLSISVIVDAIVNNRFRSTLWFFLPLFSLYLVIPFISFIPEEKRKVAFKYGILACFFCNSFLPLIFNIMRWQYNTNLYFAIGGHYIIYILLGYYLNRYKLEKTKTYFIYFLGIIGLSIHLFGTWYLSYQIGSIDQTFKGYVGVPCLFYSVSVYLAAMNIFKVQKYKIVNKILNWFSTETLGIYLIHYYLIELFIRVFKVNALSINYRLFGGILIFILSTLISKIIHKIPYLKNIC